MLASGTEINNFTTIKENYVVVSVPGQVGLSGWLQRFVGKTLGAHVAKWWRLIVLNTRSACGRNGITGPHIISA